MRAKEGGTSREMVNAIKHFCEVHGIPEQISTDEGPQFNSGQTRKFFSDWGTQHRISSTTFPHSNCRAELGVKTVKRMMTVSTGLLGSLEIDRFRRALLQYKNTPDPDNKLSPAQILFGRALRDFTPVLRTKYQQRNFGP